MAGGGRGEKLQKCFLIRQDLIHFSLQEILLSMASCSIVDPSVPYVCVCTAAFSPTQKVKFARRKENSRDTVVPSVSQPHQLISKEI